MGEVKNVSISLQPWLLWSGEGRGGADLKLVQVVGAVWGPRPGTPPPPHQNKKNKKFGRKWTHHTTTPLKVV